MIQYLLERWEELRTFMESGGDVLLAIFVVTLLMWALIFERFFYGRIRYPKEWQDVYQSWKNRSDHSSWNAEQIRVQIISEMSQRLNRSLAQIRTLIALCPLLGLLGTVSGMIEVFDVMSLVGSGNARAMAAGISLATIPTMAGMVAALSGMYFSARLDRKTRRKIAAMEQNLSMDRGETCVVA